jgi:hypothetical protein
MANDDEASHLEDVYHYIGDFGPYQLVLVILIALVSLIPSIVAYNWSFVGAVPQFRCKLPNLTNDTYEIWGDFQKELVDKYIPLNDKSSKDPYDKCILKVFSNETDFSLQKCNEWVYSQKYFGQTLITKVFHFQNKILFENFNKSFYYLKWNLVCDQSPRRDLISTLFFVGTLGKV